MLVSCGKIISKEREKTKKEKHSYNPSIRYSVAVLKIDHSFLVVQVNLCQKLLFLHQLTHNMTTDCSLNYKVKPGENMLCTEIVSDNNEKKIK